MLNNDPHNDYNLAEKQERLELLIKNNEPEQQISDLKEKIERIKESRDAIDGLNEVKKRILEYEGKLKNAINNIKRSYPVKKVCGQTQQKTCEVDDK